MHKILFITVQYTGTRFFLDLVKPVLGTPAKLSVEGAEFYHHHCMRSNKERCFELIDQGYKLITTYRPSIDIINAWLRRFPDQKDKQDLCAEEMTCWMSWVQSNAEQIFYLFDPPLRMGSLMHLNKLLDSDLTTDWTPIGHNR